MWIDEYARRITPRDINESIFSTITLISPQAHKGQIVFQMESTITVLLNSIPILLQSLYEYDQWTSIQINIMISFQSIPFNIIYSIFIIINQIILLLVRILFRLLLILSFTILFDYFWMISYINPWFYYQYEWYYEISTTNTIKIDNDIKYYLSNEILLSTLIVFITTIIYSINSWFSPN